MHTRGDADIRDFLALEIVVTVQALHDRRCSGRGSWRVFWARVGAFDVHVGHHLGRVINLGNQLRAFPTIFLTQTNSDQQAG